jgi:hypothetical protein
MRRVEVPRPMTSCPAVLRKELVEVWVEHSVVREGRTEAEAREGLDPFIEGLIDIYKTAI